MKPALSIVHKTFKHAVAGLVVMALWSGFLPSILQAQPQTLSPQPSHPAGASRQSFTVVDDRDITVTLDSPATRIISLAPSMTELLFSLGVGENVVGVVEYSDFPEAAKQIPIVGRFDRLDVERILSLQPDLIISWQSGNPRGAIQRLREMGYPVYTAEPVTVASIADTLLRLGSLTGQTERADTLSTTIHDSVEKLQRQYADATTVSVFYQVWHNPIISVGGNELINDMIMVCGGENIFADLPVGPAVNLEDIISRRPQVILASGPSPDRPDWLDLWQQWPSIPAVADNHLYAIPPDLVQRHSLRALQGLEQMCTLIDQAR